MMLMPQAIKAQCCAVDTQKLAELLVKEKKAGVLNDSVFTDFFKNYGLQYSRLTNGHGEIGFFKKYSHKGESYTMTVSFLPTYEDKGLFAGTGTNCIAIGY